MPQTRSDLLPGSAGEHVLQSKYGSEERARTFYAHQVLSFLSPAMRDFVVRQEFMFVATADRNGECDCSPRFGEPGFLRVLGDKHVIYPEMRGNGVFSSLGNISENPHVALLIIDFCRDSIGLHINGKARVIESEELLGFSDRLPKDVLAEIAIEGRRRPDRWVMVEVEEAYVQCSKHIPLLQKVERTIEWGTDSAAAKKSDYFQLLDLPLYERIGGDRAMEIAVDLFQRKVNGDALAARFFDAEDSEAQRLQQKSFVAMAFGGPYEYPAHRELSDRHFDRVIDILRETLLELGIARNDTQEILLTASKVRAIQ